MLITRATLAALALTLIAQPARAEVEQDFQAARQTTRGGGVTVALVSSGIAATPQLAGAVKGRLDLARRERPAMIEGTLIGNLLSGRRGLAPDVDLLSVRVDPEIEDFGGDRHAWRGHAQSADRYANGVRWAADQGARVILLPSTTRPSTTPSSPAQGDTTQPSTTQPGSAQPSTARPDTARPDAAQPYPAQPDAVRSHDGGLREAVQYAVDKGAVVVAPVASTVGKSTAGVVGPAVLPGVLGVVSIGAKGNPMRKYAAIGPSVLLSAPGTKQRLRGPDIKRATASSDRPSADVRKRRGAMWDIKGGQVAAAHVAAAAALVKSRYPELSPAQVTLALTATARRPSRSGWRDTPDFAYDTSLGFGLINPAGALIEASRLATARPATGIAPDARFGPPPPQPNPSPHNPVGLAGYAALLAAGLALLTLALLRRRRRT